MRRPLKPTFAACTVVLLGLVLAAPASGDGDPASDILLGQDLFLPYAPNTLSKPTEVALKTTIERAKRRGFPVKVAIIADRRDLGSVGQLFPEPQRYADLLTQEISLEVVRGTAEAPRVLTVLPGGLGGNNLGDTAGEALDGVLPDAEEGADGLGRTAVVAIGKLAAAAGKPFEVPTLPSASAPQRAGGGVPGFVLFGAPVLLLVVALVAVNRRFGADDDDVEEPAGPGATQAGSL